MRSSTLLLATGAAGVFLKATTTVSSTPMPTWPTAVPRDEPTGIAMPDDAADISETVDCGDNKMFHYEKLVFATVMGCNKAKPDDGSDPMMLCNSYVSGGCDNEHCHDACHKMYTSQETYKKCKCKNWTAATFKEHSPGNSCPLKIQPRCAAGILYRTECEALKAHPDKSANDLVVVPASEWPGGANNMKAEIGLDPHCTGTF